MGNTCPKHASLESVLGGAGRDVEIREKRVDKTCNERIKSRRWLGRLSASCCGGKTDDSVEIGERGLPSNHILITFAFLYKASHRLVQHRILYCQLCESFHYTTLFFLLSIDM